jgi:DNA-binding MarR family transcriptional regulator
VVFVKGKDGTDLAGTSREGRPRPYAGPMGAQWLSDEEQTIWRQLLTVESRLQDRLDQDLRLNHSLTLAEYGVLVHLSEAGPAGLRMSELAERLLLSRSGLTRRFDSMVRAGLVERRSCPVDGRGAVAQLTAEGHARLEEAAPTHVSGVRRYLIDPLAGRLDGLRGGLDAVDRALGDGPSRRGPEEGGLGAMEAGSAARQAG